MKKVTRVLIFILLLSPGSKLGAITIMINDLEVQSDNNSHKYIGKGLAELISFELGKSKNVDLVSREKRTQMIEEMKLSLSGLGESSKELEIGKILAAEFLISGNLINMGDAILISLKMIEVETGKIVWQDTITESLSRYDFISASMAKSALSYFNFEIANTTVAKIEEKKEKDEQAAISFSKAVDSIDKKDTTAAKEELQKAKSYDPTNEAVKAFIAKLSPTTSKFRYELDFYVSSQNPAALATIETDKFYIIQSMGIDKGENIPEVGDGYRLDETGNIVGRIGYEMPLGKKMGMSLEFMFSNIDPKIESPSGSEFYVYGEEGAVGPTNYFHPLAEHLGGSFGLGYAVNEWLSLGINLSFYSTDQRQSGDGGSEVTLRKGMDGAFGGGIMMSFLDKNLVIDSQYTHCMEQEKYLNASDPDNPETLDAHYPAIWETTLTLAMLDKRMYFVTKEILDIYTSDGAASSGGAARDGYMTRTIPALEYWLTKNISVRGGYIYTYSDLLDRTNSGTGYIGGLTLKLGSFDIDFNMTQMTRVSRLLPGYETDDTRFLIQLSYNGLFKKSR